MFSAPMSESTSSVECKAFMSRSDSKRELKDFHPYRHYDDTDDDFDDDSGEIREVNLIKELKQLIYDKLTDMPCELIDIIVSMVGDTFKNVKTVIPFEEEMRRALNITIHPTYCGNTIATVDADVRDNHELYNISINQRNPKSRLILPLFDSNEIPIILSTITWNNKIILACYKYNQISRVDRKDERKGELRESHSRVKVAEYGGYWAMVLDPNYDQPIASLRKREEGYLCLKPVLRPPPTSQKSPRITNKAFHDELTCVINAERSEYFAVIWGDYQTSTVYFYAPDQCNPFRTVTINDVNASMSPITLEDKSIVMLDQKQQLLRVYDNKHFEVILHTPSMQDIRLADCDWKRVDDIFDGQLITVYTYSGESQCSSRILINTTTLEEGKWHPLTYVLGFECVTHTVIMSPTHILLMALNRNLLLDIISLVNVGNEWVCEKKVRFTNLDWYLGGYVTRMERYHKLTMLTTHNLRYFSVLDMRYYRPGVCFIALPGENEIILIK